MVSSKWEISGQILAIMEEVEFPPIESFNKYVSLDYQ